MCLGEMAAVPGLPSHGLGSLQHPWTGRQKQSRGIGINLDLIEDSGGYSAGLGVAGYLRDSELL